MANTNGNESTPKPTARPSRWLRLLNVFLPIHEAKAAWKTSREQVAAIRASARQGKAMLTRASESAEAAGEAVTTPPVAEDEVAKMVFAGRARWWIGFLALGVAVWQSTMFVLSDAGWLARTNIGVAAVLFLVLGVAFCLQGAAVVRSAKDGEPVRLRDVARKPLWWMPY